ncbi:MAG: lysophospholipid acyltransferase family protein [Fimbriimonadaceae bacterium]|nr:lysophospholipid acyltransferase family protein [Fimbriimonadaceae bacterium]
MKSYRRPLLNKLAGGLFVGARRWFESVSLEKAERRGSALALFMMRLDRKHREQTIANVGLAFPELGESERLALAKRTYAHFGVVAADFLRSGVRTIDDVLANTSIEGIEHFHEAVARDRGIIALTAHFGNWERFAHYCTALGHGITVVARSADDESLESRVMALRAQTGMRVLARGNAAKALLGELRKRAIVGILPDQNSEECFVPFFGHPCGTVLGPGVLHQRTGAALLPAFCARVGVGKYHVILRPLLDPDNRVQNPEEIAAATNAVLESVIREYPEQYLWLHDRWRSAKRRGLISLGPK